MESTRELTEKILAVTLEIQENYPELVKYLTEMTDTMPNEKHPEVDRKDLKEYYESLLTMVKEYKHNSIDHEHQER